MLQVDISVDSLTQFLERFLLWLDSNDITLNLVKSLFSKDRLQCFFSKEGIPDWSKLGETEKIHTPKIAINFYFYFSNYVKRFIPNTVHLYTNIVQLHIP